MMRERFIADLCAALDSDGKTLHLDFVFGDVVNKEDGGSKRLRCTRWTASSA